MCLYANGIIVIDYTIWSAQMSNIHRVVIVLPKNGVGKNINIVIDAFCILETYSFMFSLTRALHISVVFKRCTHSIDTRRNKLVLKTRSNTSKFFAEMRTIIVTIIIMKCKKCVLRWQMNELHEALNYYYIKCFCVMHSVQYILMVFILVGEREWNVKRRWKNVSFW